MLKFPPIGSAAFALRFGIILAALHLLTLSPWALGPETHVLETTALVSGWLLKGIGEENRVFGAVICSPNHSLTVAPTCSAFELVAFLLAAICAFPASWPARFWGVLCCAAILAIINPVRIASLYWTKVHADTYFQTLHGDIWPALFNMISVSLMMVWIFWNRKERHGRDA